MYPGRTLQEFKNSSANLLVMPLPKERVRFYPRDNDCQLEFTGENDIDHTPKDETIRLYTGNTFDMTWVRAAAEFRPDLSSSILYLPLVGVAIRTSASVREPLHAACRIPDNDRKSYSRSCGRCQTPCKVP
jgi:hypothetical protein